MSETLRGAYLAHSSPFFSCFAYAQERIHAYAQTDDTQKVPHVPLAHTSSCHSNHTHCHLPVRRDLITVRLMAH